MTSDSGRRPARTPLERQSLEFRAAIIAEDAVAIRAMAQAMQRIVVALDSQITTLSARIAAQAARGRVSPGAVAEFGEFIQLRREAEERLTRYVEDVDRSVTATQRRRITLALNNTRALAETALPPGLTFDVLANLGIQWATVDPRALEFMVGRMRDGTSLRAYLGARVVNGTVQAMVDTLTTGITRNPILTARALRHTFAGGAFQALRIARTETTRVYRDSARAGYQENPRVVRGYRRVASRDDRCCAACWILDGTLYASQGDMDEHVLGRCFTVPETVTWKELGLQGPEVERGPTGRQVFEGLPAERQRAIIGNERQYRAWASGQISTADLVTRQTHPTFDGQFIQASARQSLAGGGLARLPRPDEMLQGGVDLTRR